MKVTLALYWFYFLQVSIHYALGSNIPRSDIIDDGKPILRIGEDDYDNITTIQNENENTTNPQWLTELRSRIPQFIDEHGYRDAKPYIQELVEDTEKQMNVLLHVEVAQNGTTSIEVGPTFRSKKHKKHLTSRDGELENAPTWLKEFKTFMKALVQGYGWSRTQQMMSHLIETIEKQHGVVIVDVDREVLVHYYNTTEHFSLNSEEKSNKD